MNNNHIDIIRSGINTTFQDKGRDHLYHIGIPFSGAMDNRNFLIANKLVNNNLNSAVIEFAYQGPHIKYLGEKINIAITGDVIFSIKKKMLKLKVIVTKVIKLKMKMKLISFLQISQSMVI